MLRHWNLGVLFVTAASVTLNQYREQKVPRQLGSLELLGRGSHRSQLTYVSLQPCGVAVWFLRGASLPDTAGSLSPLGV